MCESVDWSFESGALMGKRVTIVFEETEAVDGGIGFNVFLDGLDQHRRTTINAMTPEEQLQELSTAEFWALRCFQITMSKMIEAGAVREIKKKGT